MYNKIGGSMKKMSILMITLLVIFIPIPVLASQKISVTLNKCVDGDTAWFNEENKKIKARFLAIDTPESTIRVDPYGKEASEFTCNLLTNAAQIQIEYDDNSDKQDKYNRELVWVFVDEKLLQEQVVKEGLAEVKYIYGDYKYLDDVNNALQEAKKKKLNLWSDNESDNTYDYLIVGIGICVVIIMFFLNKTFRKNFVKKFKSLAKKEFKKSLNKLK